MFLLREVFDYDYAGIAIHYAFSFEIVAERVRAIYIISNPDKLRHLAADNSTRNTDPRGSRAT